MKREVWLRTNRRAALASVFGYSLLFGVVLAVASLITQSGLRWCGFAGAAILALLFGRSLWRMLEPRLSYADGHLLVHLSGSVPTRVPIECVECFFRGQAPSMLPPVLDPPAGGSESATVVVRLAEAATEWKQFDVNPQLGQWCEGYITIRGTWCEPLSNDLVLELNRRLIAAHRAKRESSAMVSA